MPALLRWRPGAAAERVNAMCQSRPHASQQKHRYSITSSGRASSGSGSVRLSPRLEPAVAAELHIKRGADSNYEADHEEIAVGPLELGHVLEIHPVDSC